MGIIRFLVSLVGSPPGPITVAPPRNGDPEESEGGDSGNPFLYYNTFQLADARVFIEALEAVEIPFEVEFDDGIEEVNFNFGSGGTMAKATFYIEAENHPEADELVRLYFH